MGVGHVSNVLMKEIMRKNVSIVDLDTLSTRIRKLSVNSEEKKEMMCQRCHQEQIMIVEPGPTIVSNWWIGECVECGQRHDIWG